MAAACSLSTTETETLRTRILGQRRRTRRRGPNVASRSIARIAALLKSVPHGRLCAVRQARTFWTGLQPSVTTTINGKGARSISVWSTLRIQSLARSTRSFLRSTKTNNQRIRAMALQLILPGGFTPVSLLTVLKNPTMGSFSASKTFALHFAPSGTRSARGASRLLEIANCARRSISSLRSLRKANKYLTKFSELPTGLAIPASTLACYLRDVTINLCAIPAGSALLTVSMIFVCM